jgi:hypothetical protein
MPTTTPLRTAFVARIRAARAAWAANRALEREIACYTTVQDLNDLHAILDRYSDRETADIRRILAAHPAA